MIYFITDYDYIKIGTTNNLFTRFNELQTSNARKLHIVATTEGSYKEEADLHNKFKDCRYNREWFHYTEDIQSFIKSLDKYDRTVETSIFAVNLYNTKFDEIRRTIMHINFKCNEKGFYFTYCKDSNKLKYTIPLTLLKR